jgi:hypothetical protein
MESATVTEVFKHQVCFRPLTNTWPSMEFPCDALGRVDLDILSPAEKNDYLFARAMMGRDYAAPAVRPRG